MVILILGRKYDKGICFKIDQEQEKLLQKLNLKCSTKCSACIYFRVNHVPNKYDKSEANLNYCRFGVKWELMNIHQCKSPFHKLVHLNLSGVAKLGHTGARALATGGCAPPCCAGAPETIIGAECH